MACISSVCANRTTHQHTNALPSLSYPSPNDSAPAFRSLVARGWGADERRGKFGPWVEGVRKISLGIATNFSLLRISHNRAFISKLYNPTGKARVSHPSSRVGGILSSCAPTGMPRKKETEISTIPPSNPMAPLFSYSALNPSLEDLIHFESWKAINLQRSNLYTASLT
ncbi:hypothetical protein TNIN_388771 [Trichonephila inaurata madagascariensis]|uniref:Uncharacterized protein n=1 Tax=Trichonephila inaurata madagascariensis TaxID=2747483 RepID=A0A8X6I818_9ARAC|nr:hypothetical protein TNIN_388771 [Trichonephila inaurata madagascariensis]